MSPALDMPLNRREALASVIAMLAFVLGAGARAMPRGFPRNPWKTPIRPYSSILHPRRHGR